VDALPISGRAHETIERALKRDEVSAEARPAAIGNRLSRLLHVDRQLRGG
jgi:hypothetical protein